MMSALARIAPNIYTSLNESIHNVFNCYRDKTLHYVHYDLLYQMAFLDFNENCNHLIKYSYKTTICGWKKNHTHRHNRTVKEKKTFYWKKVVICKLFPQYRKWYQ